MYLRERERVLVCIWEYWPAVVNIGMYGMYCMYLNIFTSIGMYSKMVCIVHISMYGYICYYWLVSLHNTAVDFVAVQATESVCSSAAALAVMKTAASELIYVLARAAPNLVIVFAPVHIAIRSQFTYELLRWFRVVSESVELDNLSNCWSLLVAVLV